MAGDDVIGPVDAVAAWIVASRASTAVSRFSRSAIMRTSAFGASLVATIASPSRSKKTR